ncbi:MAG: glycosyltransferase family 4 protein [Bacteroidetes bacterium]|nr:glycosyltransferase family 4 protein [Bacteroidota bacterium]
MHIALVTPEFVTEASFDGGLANYIYKLAKWLKSQQHKVTIFLVSETSGSFVFEDITIERIKIIDYAWRINYQAKRFKISFLFPEKLQCFVAFRQASYFVKKTIKQFNKKHPIDIIQYPHLSGYSFYKVKNVPSIVRLSSSTYLCNAMGGWGRSDTYMKSLEKFEVMAMRKSEMVFGPSKMIAELVEPQIGKHISIIETPYMAPESKLDNSMYESVLKEKRYVLFFGSIGLIKGVGTIAEIIYDLLKTNKDLYYIFVGKQLHNKINETDLWDYLMGKAAEFSDRVIHIPAQKHPALFPIIQNAQLVTLPSRTDNFPNTCIESMANKKIVIGTKGNGFDQLINDNENGFVVEVDNSTELLDKINCVLQLDIETKNKIEQKAFERSRKLHPDIVLNQVIELYKKTINELKTA